MHRWLCTTAPLLIGSIAVGTIHAAPMADACARKHYLPRANAGSPPLPLYAQYRSSADTSGDRVRFCSTCHDGTVARVDVDMRADTPDEARMVDADGQVRGATRP